MGRESPDRGVRHTNTMPKTKKPENTSSPKLGSKDFTDMMYRGVPSWYVFAVEAPLDDVTEAFTRLRQAKRVVRDVPVVPTKKYESIGVLVPVVKPVGSSWVVVQRAACLVTSQQLNQYAEDAKTLSKRLKTRAVAFAAEDTSGSGGYDLYEYGTQVERACWGELSEFASKRRKTPKHDTYDVSFVDETFRELGIYLPVCLGRDGAKPSLAIDKSATGVIERAHLVELESWG